MSFEENHRLQLTARLDEFVKHARSAIALETPAETHQAQCRNLESRMEEEIGRIRDCTTPLDVQKQTEKMMQLGMEKARLIQEHEDTLPGKQKAWLDDIASALVHASRQYMASLSNSETSMQTRGFLEYTAVDPLSIVSPLPESSPSQARESPRHSEAEEIQTNAASPEFNRPRRASTMNKRRISEGPGYESAARTVTTIHFDDVYQDGQAEIKYTIYDREHSLTTDASVKGRWWILRCEQHNVNYAFGKGANRSGPKRHLVKHENCSPDCISTNRHIDVFGVLVVGCTAELAKKNNDDVEAAISNGYNPKAPGISESQSQRKRRKTSSEGASGNQLILDPEFGKLYMSLWGSQMFAVALLPLRKLSTLIPPEEMDKLMEKPPNGYNYDEDTGLLSRWAPGFEDGGPKVKQRAFPFRCFDNTEDISRCTFTFLKATDLHELDLSRVSPQYHAVVQEYQEKFLERDTRFNDSDYSDGMSDASRLQTPEPTEDDAIAEQLQSEIPGSDPQNPASSANSARNRNRRRSEYTEKKEQTQFR
ncbi:unnamed protein product [Clonostachys byssicola]|uniref:Uncharacterized protein n=1 Tax=Clonostachys byssicola TaxID=160290 RepID=A0A9N9UKW1_9HYPO|nr:unnamed protein product [Clonostachys byssicola]